MAAAQYTALIRLPFARGDFVDPPQADWNATKDRALWKVISKTSKTSDLNWVELATRFQVPATFLLQQAAWLYERHLDHVKSQMRKVGGSNAPTTSTLSTIPSPVGGVPMRRGGSSGSAASRTISALSMRPRDSPIPRGDVTTPVPTLSRTPSTNTITQSRAHTQQVSLRAQPQRFGASTNTANQKRNSQVRVTSEVNSSRDSMGVESPDDPVSSSSSSSQSGSDDELPVHRSQLFKRPPRFRQQRNRDLIASDDAVPEGEEPDSNSNQGLPFAHASRATATDSRKRDSRGSSFAARNRPRADQRLPRDTNEQETKSQTTDATSSLASSASDVPKPATMSPSPLSPNHRAELARLSPRRSGARSRKEGSEGTPSMGSSFSDLDDASITQSALEEALLSNIQHGRMSTLSQLRSRYL